MFLALSGLMMAVVFMGTSTTISRTRFTDSVRDTQSIMQQIYSDTLNSVNTRSSATSCNPATAEITTGMPVPEASGRSQCIHLGKAVSFLPGDSTLRVYDIVGTTPLVDDFAGKSADYVLEQYNPKAVTTSSMVYSYDLPGGITVRSACVAEKERADEAAVVQFTNCVDPTKTVNVFMVLRSPISGESKSYAFDTGITSGPDIFSYGNILQQSGPSGYVDFDSGLAANPAHVSTNLCVLSGEGDRTSLLRIGGQLSGGQSSVTTASDLTPLQVSEACE